MLCLVRSMSAHYFGLVFPNDILAALDEDSLCAMAHWGISHSLGINYNDTEIDAARMQRAYNSGRNAIDTLEKRAAGMSGVRL